MTRATSKEGLEKCGVTAEVHTLYLGSLGTGLHIHVRCGTGNVVGSGNRECCYVRLGSCIFH